ncbi:hypothetical protein GCM10023078_22290 [Gibbsiella greigii]
MKKRILWLNAADCLVDAYLNPAENIGFDSVSVLTALENVSDALYYLDEPLCQFIVEHTCRWFGSGMTAPADFVACWQRVYGRCEGSNND